jgi:hypothetical protein
MAFGAFENLGEVLRAYQVQLRQERFVQPQPAPVDERFRARLELLRASLPVSASERSICEFLIAPVLLEVWLPYGDALTIWSHVKLRRDETLAGYPDYCIAKRSPLSPIVQDRPYVAFAQAKKDDFDAGWGQCLAAMLAAQKLNEEPEGVIYGGGVSNGGVWYLGKLQGRLLTQDPRGFTLGDLEGLFAALNYVFAEAKARVLAYVEAEAKA